MRRRTAGIVAILVLAAAAGMAWHKVVRHRFFPRNFGTVAAGAVYRSGRLTPMALAKVVREHHLRTIVDLDGCSEEAASEASRAEALGLEYRRFCLSGDGRGSASDYAQVLRIMADPGCQPVLVHCAAGAQRTSGVVLAYRRLVEGRNLVEAYPECFGYGHEPDDWVLLAFLADEMEAIRLALGRGPAETRSDDDAGTDAAP